MKGELRGEIDNYKEIFNQLKINFMMMSDEEYCCGLPILNAGYRKDAKKLASKNFEVFREKGISKIITSCPSCFYMFNDVYPKLLREWDIEVEHATITILRALKRRGIKWRGAEDKKEIVAYHDPCYLGRYSGIYEEPREVIELLGGKIIESRFNRKDALCCGAGGGVRENFEKLSKEIAKKRTENFAEEAKKIISPCGLCHLNLKSASDKSLEFSTFVLGKLRGLKNGRS